MPKTISPRLLVDTRSDVTVIGFANSAIVSEEAIREIIEHIGGLTEGPGPVKMLLSFHQVTSMSGRMLAVLLWLARKIERSGGSMKLCCITPHLLDHFEITRLYRHFEIYTEESIALDSFSQSRPGLSSR